MLKVEEVTKVFKLGGLIMGSKLKAVDRVSFALEDNTILSIVGESGSGKTTLARMILGLIEPSSGKILYKNQNVFRLKGLSLKNFRQEVQPIFQNPFEAFNPLTKVESYLISTAKGYMSTSQSGTEILETALATVGLSYDVVKNKYVHEFSGGELQRIAIARALISKPKLLVCDEPTSMVDASMRMEILNLLLELNKTNNTSIVHITHDLAVAYYLSDEVAIMYRGNIVEYGPVEAVLKSPAHPYTELLRNSVPIADPKDRWKEEITLSGMEIKEFETPGCKFAGRCPYAEKVCFEERPPDVKTGNRLVKCWLYDTERQKVKLEKSTL
jgi:peptide/nickel transport system ATP-binding protein